MVKVTTSQQAAATTTTSHTQKEPIIHIKKG